MKKIIFLLSFFNAISYLGLSQMMGDFSSTHDYLNLLKNQLQATTDNQEKAILLCQIGEGYMYINMDSTFHFAEKAISLAKQEGLIRTQLGAMGFKNQGLINIGNLPKALESSLAVLELGKDVPPSTAAGIGPTLDNLGQIYYLIGDYKRAIKYWRIEEGLGETDLMGVAYGKWNIAQVFYEQNQLDSALFYLEDSYTAFGNINYAYYPAIYHVYPHWYNVRAKIFIKQGKEEQALKDYQQSLQMSAKNKEPVLSAETCNELAKFYDGVGQVDSSTYYALTALNFASESNYTKGIYDAASFLATYYETEDPSNALAYIKLANENQNKLYGAGNMETIRELILKDEQKTNEIAAQKLSFQNQLRQNILLVGLLFLLLMAFILFRNNRKTKKTNTILNHQKTEIENTLNQLKSTQKQLVQAEKMASLGELTAGIAHEIQNPLNFVNNFAEVSNELIEELKEELAEGNTEDVLELTDMLTQNLQKINHHGVRASGIVKGMLAHSRSSTGNQKELTDLNSLCDEYLRLAYHGLRAKDKSFNASYETNLDAALPKLEVVPQDIGRVILNLINNAFYVVNEKGKEGIDGYEPKVVVCTKFHPPTPANGMSGLSPRGEKSDGKREGIVEISVKDNGEGIPKDIIDKIFQPFFTTKPTGQGTGLGLSLSYDIVKAHGGELNVESKEGKGTTFKTLLPITAVQ